MARPSLDEYVDVAERIQQFKEAYPEGTLQRIGDPVLLDAGGNSYVVYTAAAYRTHDDPRPGVGTAWEKVPGTTPYTRDSELMNAETAAWGRAIIALGFASKKIASKQEVQARQGEDKPRMPVEKAQELRKRITMDWPSVAMWLGANGVSQTEDEIEALRELTPAKAKELLTWVKNGG